jgi:hypothetical protein
MLQRLSSTCRAEKVSHYHFHNPLNLNGRVGPFAHMNCEISQGKTQIALGMPRTATRPEMAEKCLEMEEHRVRPTIISKKDAPIKQNTMVGDKVDLYEIPITRWTAGYIL